MTIERFEDIEACQFFRELTRKVYDLTKKGKFARDLGLRGQIQESASSSKVFRGSKFGLNKVQ